MAIDVTAPSANESLLAWVSDAISLCEPDHVHWCDGSTEEYERLCGLLVETGTFERLSEELRPSSFLQLDALERRLRDAVTDRRR